MTIGLVISVIGTRTIEGGSDGAVAGGLLPVFWVAALVTVGELISFSSPLIAASAARFSPAKVLVSADFAEAALSTVAVLLLVLWPGGTVPILVTYLLVAAIFPAVGDVVEEFYGQQLAQVDVHEALTFNASIYSALAFVGIVVAMPFGSILSGVSIVMLIGANAVFSWLGASFRIVSARTVITPPLLSQDPEEFDALGSRMPVREFLHDLWRSGFASPLYSLIEQMGATLSGVFVYLAIARQSGFDPSVALAVVIATFGAGATIGPWIGKAMAARLNPRALLIGVTASTVVMLTLFALAMTLIGGQWFWWIGLAYALLLGVASRVREVVITTLRQREYRGKRFSRIMSWSFSATALGAIVGSWIAVAIRAVESPSAAILSAAALLLIAALIASMNRPKTITRRDTTAAG
ncbi:MFS transporter [uncultured Microbacterium sp.]|uniref:MFS transporter n=1 Tax=uncultured Microbacterium sp. TaxID=191216 RepID=UPI0025E926B5|nr:MFS transporter [uncultured Microbacterium sp.]